MIQVTWENVNNKKIRKFLESQNVKKWEYVYVDETGGYVSQLEKMKGGFDECRRCGVLVQTPTGKKLFAQGEVIDAAQLHSLENEFDKKNFFEKLYKRFVEGR